MTSRLTLGRLVAGAAIVCVFQLAQAATLYDPALNTLPSAQGWTTAGIGPYSESVAAGTYQFSTLQLNATQAGSARFGNAALDTASGFTLDFNLRVLSEVHAREDRAGFSIIMTGLDPAHSIEIAFWGDHVWSYTSSFAHGVDAAFDTMGAAHDYALVVKNDAYVLKADGTTLFSGPLVDYVGQPYDSAGFLFFGDDTSSARSQVELGRITLTAAAVPAVPEPATTALFAIGLVALALTRRVYRG